jgi:hypothetical protein
LPDSASGLDLRRRMKRMFDDELGWVEREREREREIVVSIGFGGTV